MPNRPNRSFTKPAYWGEATRALAKRDVVMARLVAAYPEIHVVRRGDPFTTLARAIVGQQISVKAAQSIWDRLATAAKGTGDPVHLDPARVGRTRMTTLRRVGLSENKALYIRDLARHFVSGALDPGEWPALPDEDLILRLTTVHGIGRWTAEMFLMFQLGRLDVWPVDDLGVRKGYGRLFRLPAMPTPKELQPLGEPMRPYRSVAAWYCWRVADIVDPSS
jgi:DNA-3-methyladenine glycosylase II